jgi:transcriptional repressor NrdR
MFSSLFRAFMRCPLCSNLENRVLESRAADGGHSVRRRRECLNLTCGHRFTTYERIDTVPITILKRDGRRESFDRNKVLSGLQRACDKTPLSFDQVEEVVSQVEAALQKVANRDIPSTEIGEMVLHQLRSLNQVAYIRFASVYSQFQTIQDFMAVVRQMQDHPESDGLAK